ncbi:MAG: protein-L-isoaspartate(D-aspartate) O-methyltransferase [Gemmatimonadota bacterium]|nr:protein-L-isoaspartate(D-aspartate) O-methyltransferase [Gemmatimonadota bacterium]
MNLAGKDRRAKALSRSRMKMVTRDLAPRGNVDEAVLEAMATVPRELFVPQAHAHRAYEDRPLPIGEGQTISQPYVVAVMASAAELTPRDRVLEVGTGSGYGAAILAQVAREVHTIERHPNLAARARQRFEDLGYGNIDVIVGDGTLGLPGRGPFDAIVVTAGSPSEPPPALLEQLAPGGRLIIPTGDTRYHQELTRIRRSADGTGFERESLGGARFVPLIGEAAWTNDESHANPGPPRDPE